MSDNRIVKVKALLRLWKTKGYIYAKSRPTQWVYGNLSNCSMDEFYRLVSEHVNKTDDLREATKSEGFDDDPVFQTTPTIFDRKLYVKFSLDDAGDDVEDCTLLLVSVHDSNS